MYTLWREFWDRMSASDPGLLRMLHALTVVGGVLLTLAVLAIQHAPVQLLVVGGLVAMVASFAVSDPRPRDQAITLAAGLPVAAAVMALGTVLYRYRAASDAFFVALVFAAVYIRRFGARGTGLGLIGFQCYFVSQFAHGTPALLPSIGLAIVIAFAASAVVRFAVVRNFPRRILIRLYRAFRVRLAALLEATADLIEADTAYRVERARRNLHRRTVRLHQCALMVQTRLESALPDPETAALVERRIAESEVAAERLARLVERASARLRPGLGATAGNLAVQPALGIDLRTLAALIAAPMPGTRALTGSATFERLLHYRDGADIPSDDAVVRDVYQAAGGLARAVRGLRAVTVPTTRTRPESAASREDAVPARGEPGGAGATPPADAGGLRRGSTRLAFQVAVGSALAIVGGELLSAQRWYWAVLTCWVVFINTTSTGEILIKGYRRLAGTVAGVVAGGALAALVGADPRVAFALVILCIFGMFSTAALSYGLMSFFVTTMIGLLYSLLGTFSRDVLLLRVEESAVGAACGFLAATVVLPVPVGRHTDERLCTVLGRLGTTVAAALSRLSADGAVGAGGDPIHTARELDAALDALHTSMEPVIHPVNPLRPRRQRALYLTRLLDGCAYHARAMAAVAQSHPGELSNADGSGAVVQEGERISHDMAVIAEYVCCTGSKQPSPGWSAAGEGPIQPVDPDLALGAVAVRTMRHLHRIEESQTALARLLGVRTAHDDASDDSPPARPVPVAASPEA